MADYLRLRKWASAPFRALHDELVVWAEDDGSLHTMDEDGTETEVGAGGNGGSQPGAWYYEDVRFDEPDTPATLPITVVDLGFPITAVDQGTPSFTVAGDHADLFLAGDAQFGVAGSTGNDGTYNVVDAVFGAGVTVVTVFEEIPDTTADGFAGVPGGPIGFRVAGDHTDDFPAATEFFVFGSSGNDGPYTVASSVFGGGATAITTTVAPADPTADGTIGVPIKATFDVPEGGTVLDVRVYGITPWTPEDDITLQMGDTENPTGYADGRNNDMRLPAYDPSSDDDAGLITMASDDPGLAPGVYKIQYFLSAADTPRADGVHYPDGDTITLRVLGPLTGGGGGSFIVRTLVAAGVDPIVAS